MRAGVIPNAELIPASPRDARFILPEARALASIRAVQAWIGKNSCEKGRIVCTDMRKHVRANGRDRNLRREVYFARR